MKFLNIFSQTGFWCHFQRKRKELEAGYTLPFGYLFCSLDVWGMWGNCWVFIWAPWKVGLDNNFFLLKFFFFPKSRNNSNLKQIFLTVTGWSAFWELSEVFQSFWKHANAPVGQQMATGLLGVAHQIGLKSYSKERKFKMCVLQKKPEAFLSFRVFVVFNFLSLFETERCNSRLICRFFNCMGSFCITRLHEIMSR